MKDGKKLLGELGELGPQQVYFRTHNLLTSGDGTPGPQVGLDRTPTREDADGKPVYDWTIVDRIFDTYLERGVQALRPDRLHAQGAVDQARAVPAQVDARGEVRRDLHRLGLPAEGLREVGRAGLPVGEALRREVRPGRKSRRGTGRCGTSRTSATGGARRRSSASCTTTRSTPSGGRCRRRGSAARTPPAAGGTCASSSSTACAGRTTRPARRARRSTSSRSTPRARRAFVDGHVRMGIANQLRTIDANFGIIASFPELKDKPIVIGESDPDGCAACQGPQLGYRNGTMYSSYTAASFARKHDLADEARREPGRGADLGVRVRGPAVLRRLPRAGDQRHRPAGAQRLPHVRAR